MNTCFALNSRWQLPNELGVLDDIETLRKRLIQAQVSTIDILVRTGCVRVFRTAPSVQAANLPLCARLDLRGGGVWLYHDTGTQVVVPC